MINPDKLPDGISLNDQILLEKCRDIELLSRDLYTCFAETYKNSVEANQLWLKTAQEEQNHADQFTLALKLRKGIQLRTDSSHKKAEQLIKNLQTTLVKVQQSPPTLIEALEFCIKLEHFLDDLHLCCMTEFSDPSFSNFFTAMMSSDQEHIASIELLLKKLTATVQNDPMPIAEQKTVSASDSSMSAEKLEPYQGKILELFKEQELLMASLYQHLARLFPAHANDYAQLVAEEMEHAGWIDQLQSACLSGKARFAEGKTRSYTISGMISYLKDFKKRLETGDITELQALTAVTDFENALIERNIFQRFSGDTTEVAKKLSFLEDNQKKHTSRITALLQKLRAEGKNH